MKQLQLKMPGAKIQFDSGKDMGEAAAAAASADVAIVFVHQWEAEGADLPSLQLPENQDALVSAIAAANQRTIVVLENGSPVTMPWREKTQGDSGGVVRRKQRGNFAGERQTDGEDVGFLGNVFRVRFILHKGQCHPV